MEKSLLYYRGVHPPAGSFDSPNYVEYFMDKSKGVSFNTSKHQLKKKFTFVVKKRKTTPEDSQPGPGRRGGFGGWGRRMARKKRYFGGRGMGKSGRGDDDEQKEDDDEPQDYNLFKEELKRKEKEKRQRYYKTRGRPKGGAKEDERPLFVLTEEMKLAMGEVKDELFGRRGLEYPKERGALYNSRQVFRAVEQFNHDLLDKAFNDLKAHNPLMNKSADDKRNVMHFALEKDDKVAVEMILKYMEENKNRGGGGGWGWKQPKRKRKKHQDPTKRVQIYSSLQHIGTGRLSKYALGRHVKKVNLSRGNRQGNNAFTDDVHCYANHVNDWQFRNGLNSCVAEGKVSAEMMEFFLIHPYTRDSIHSMVNKVSFEVSTMGVLLTHLQKDRQGFGVSKLHVAALLNTEEEGLGKYRVNQILKKEMNNGFTPVHLAALNKNTSRFLDELISQNPLGLSARDNEGRKPIHYAAANEKLHCLEYLVGSGGDAGDPTELLETPLIIAAKKNRAENVTFILDILPETANIKDNMGNTALHHACQRGNAGAVRALLANSAVDVNVKNNEKQTPIVFSVRRGDFGIVKMFAERGADMKVLDKHGKCLLMESIKNLHFELTKYFIIEVGLDPTRQDTSGNSVIHYASGYDNLDALKLLLACGCDSNVTNQWKSNPLQIAMLKSNWFIFDFLLQNSGIDINAKDEQGKTMVFLLLEKKDQSYADQIIHLVSEKGADISIRDVEGTSLFHLLAKKPSDDDLKVAEFLIQKKAEVNLKEKDGKTPLVRAALAKNFPIFEFLLKNGAKIEESGEVGEANILHYVLQALSFEQKEVEISPEEMKKKNSLEDEGEFDEEDEDSESDDGFGFGGGGFGGGGFGQSGGVGVGDPKKKRVWVLDTKYYDLIFEHLKNIGEEKMFGKLSLGVNKKGRTPMMSFMDRFYSQTNKDQLELLRGFIQSTLLYSKSSIEDHALVKIEKKKKEEEEEEEDGGFGLGRGGARRHRGFGWGGKAPRKQPQVKMNKDDVGKTMLHFAILNTNRALIEILLNFEADVNFGDINKVTPTLLAIQLAAENYSTFQTIGKKLIAKGGDLLLVDKDERGVLHYVFTKKKKRSSGRKKSRGGFGWGGGYNNNNQFQEQGGSKQGKEPIELLSDLCVFDIPIDSPDTFGRSPLHYASIRGHTICSMFLIDKKADVNRADVDGNTPLSLALQAKLVDYSICLINKGANIKSKMMELNDVNVTYQEERKAMEEAAKKQEMKSNKIGKGGRMRKMKVARKSKRRTKRKKKRPKRSGGFGWGATHDEDEEEEEEEEEEKKVPISIFKFIIKKGFMGMFFLALSQGISFFEGIQDAITLQQWSLVLKIFEKTKRSVICSANEKGENVFHYIARAEVPKSKTVEFLKIASTLTSEYQVNPNLKNKDKVTPFVYACYARNKSMMDFFLTHCQCDVNAQDPTNNNISPLIHFIQKNDLENVKYLLSQPKIDVNLVDGTGRSAIFYVAQPTSYGSFQNIPLFLALMNRGVDVGIKDDKGLDIFYYIFLQKVPLLRDFGKIKISEEKRKQVLDQTNQVKQILRGTFSEFPAYFKEEEVKKWDVVSDFEKMKESLVKKDAEKPKIDPAKYHKVNPVAKLPEGCVVHSENINKTKKVFYDVVLTKTDISYGTYGFNMFYKLQLVHNPMQELYILINNYGRVGQTGAYQMTPFDQLEDGKKEFEKIFRSKTKNVWQEYVDRGLQFESHERKYQLVEYHRQHGLQRALFSPINLEEFPESKLPFEVQNLLSLCGDVKLMENLLANMDVDTSLFSLGNLSRKTLEEGHAILCQLLQLARKQSEKERYIWGRSNEGKERMRRKRKRLQMMSDLSSKYYQLLPSTRFRSSLISPLQKVDNIEAKKLKIERMLEMEKTLQSFLASQSQKIVSPLDYVYQTLGCDISPLEKDSVSYQMISEMTNSTTEGMKKKIVSIFKVRSSSDWNQFEDHVASQGEKQKKTKKMLLFHGTKVTNLLSILQGGLKIQPKFAKRTGRLFGDGVYFSDSFTKSLGYSFNFGDFGVMLVAECDVGQPMCSFVPGIVPVQFLPVDSVKGVGRVGIPKNRWLIHTYEGVYVPNGLAARKSSVLREEIEESDKIYDAAYEKVEKELLGEAREDWITVTVFNENMGWSSDPDHAKKQTMEVKVSPKANVYVLKKQLSRKKEVKLQPKEMILNFMGRNLEDHEVVSEIDDIAAGESKVFMSQDWNKRSRKHYKRRNDGKEEKEEEEEEVRVLDPILNFNEYILYEEKRFRIRYIIQFEF